MSHNLIINKVTFKPSTELARRFGYTSDYVSRLAREGKVAATRVGRQWFVSPDSLADFVTASEKNKALQKEELRKIRKQEREQHTPLVESVAATVALSQLPVARRTADHKREVFQVTVAAVLSLVTVSGGIIIGLLGSGMVQPVDLSLRSNFNLISRQAVDHSAGASLSGVDPVVAPLDERAQVSGESGEQYGIVVFDAETDEETVSRVRDSFSDEVEVEFRGVDTGVVTPQFRDRSGEQYQFLLVPVAEAS